MFYFGSHSNLPVYGVLIDISSGSVGVAIVLSKLDDKLPRLLYTHRVTMRVSAQSSKKDENLRRVREALFSAMLLLSQEGVQALYAHNPKAKISKINVTCSSPWSYTISRNVHYEDAQPFKITHTLMTELINSAEEEVIAHLRDMALTTKNGFEIVERATVDVTVNDYPVAKPFQLKATMLGLSHVVGAIPREVIEPVNEVQDKLFPHTELRIHTYMLVAYNVMRDIFPRRHSLCIIDVTGEATEFGIVENNVLAENIFVSYGSNTFIRDTTAKTKMPTSDILTRVHAYSDEDKKLDSALTEYMDTYISHIEQALNEILSRRMIPSDVIITTPKPFGYLMKHILEIALKKTGQTQARVLTIDAQVLEEASQEPDIDIYLALAARFFHKLYGYSESDE